MRRAGPKRWRGSGGGERGGRDFSTAKGTDSEPGRLRGGECNGRAGFNLVSATVAIEYDGLILKKHEVGTKERVPHLALLPKILTATNMFSKLNFHAPVRDAPPARFTKAFIRPVYRHTSPSRPLR